MATTIGDSVAICCKLDGSSGGYCSAGMYQLEGTGCVNCGIGKFTITQGSQSCSDCAIGMYQEFEGSTACTDCAIGMAQKFLGSTACITCKKGYFSSSSGSGEPELSDQDSDWNPSGMRRVGSTSVSSTGSHTVMSPLAHSSGSSIPSELEAHVNGERIEDPAGRTRSL